MRGLANIDDSTTEPRQRTNQLSVRPEQVNRYYSCNIMALRTPGLPASQTHSKLVLAISRLPL